MVIKIRRFASIGIPGSQLLKGDKGARGPIGLHGIAVINGKTIQNATIKPATSIGTVGDFYINNTSDTLYGPKLCRKSGQISNKKKDVCVEMLFK